MGQSLEELSLFIWSKDSQLFKEPEGWTLSTSDQAQSSDILLPYFSLINFNIIQLFPPKILYVFSFPYASYHAIVILDIIIVMI